MRIKKVKGYEIPPVERVTDKNPTRPGQDQYDKNKTPYVVKISPEAGSKQEGEESHPKTPYEKFFDILKKYLR